MGFDPKLQTNLLSLLFLELLPTELFLALRGLALEFLVENTSTQGGTHQSEVMVCVSTGQ